jgi:hypothetical protein
MNQNICFFHVGENITQPSMLVETIIKFNPNSNIIHFTNNLTPKIPGITKRIERNSDLSKLMFYRTESFSKSKLEGPSLYIDTDMLCIGPIDVGSIISSKEIVMCRRSFMNEKLFNGKFRGLDFMEYDKKTLGEVYPYLGCATAMNGSEGWEKIFKEYLKLNEKYQIWYGDQEALKNTYLSSNDNTIGIMHEKDYACLPEMTDHLKRAKIIHFKGAHRKNLMKDYHNIIINEIQ